MAFDLPFIREAVTQFFQKSSCEEYPFKPKEAFEGYRGRILFHPEKCIHCGMCERVCAGGAIHTELLEHTEEGDRYERSFFLGSCTFCSHCADFCSRKAIELTRDYAMTATDPEQLIVRGSYLKKKPAPKPKPVPKAAPAGEAAAKAPIAETPAAPKAGAETAPAPKETPAPAAETPAPVKAPEAEAPASQAAPAEAASAAEAVPAAPEAKED